MDSNFNTADTGEDSDAYSSCFTITQLASSIPFQISFRLPFSQNRINIGKDSFERLRKRTRLNPDDSEAHITLAARLLSEERILPVHAEEAADHLGKALGLMPSDEEIGDKAQWKAMTHKFLGDALIVLERRSEARHHWKRAVALDPVAPPYGISGPAQEMLNKYPQE